MLCSFCGHLKPDGPRPLIYMIDGYGGGGGVQKLRLMRRDLCMAGNVPADDLMAHWIEVFLIFHGFNGRQWLSEKRSQDRRTKHPFAYRSHLRLRLRLKTQ